MAKKKPFGTKGTGYRDALIWQTVLTEAANGPVALITNNTRDFCNDDETGLASDLVSELNADGLAATQVRWYRDLRSFIDAAVPVADRTLEEVRDRLANDPEFRHGMFNLISQAATDLALYDDWETGRPLGNLDLPTDTSDPTLEFFEVERVELDDAHEGEGGEVILDVTSRGEAQIDLFAPKWSAFSDEAEIFIEDGDWNEWMVWAKAMREMDLQVTVSYNPATRELSNPDITSWEGVQHFVE